MTMEKFQPFEDVSVAPIKNGDVPTKNGDFPTTNGDFPTKNGDFRSQAHPPKPQRPKAHPAYRLPTKDLESACFAPCQRQGRKNRPG